MKIWKHTKRRTAPRTGRGTVIHSYRAQTEIWKGPMRVICGSARLTVTVGKGVWR